MASPPLPVNAAAFSGAISWADGLLDRVAGASRRACAALELCHSRAS